MSERRYPVVIEQTGTGYSAYSPDVAGCAAVGDTVEETRRNFRVASSAHFEVTREIGEPISERTRLTPGLPGITRGETIRPVPRTPVGAKRYPQPSLFEPH